MKKLQSLILSFVCLLSAAGFAACGGNEDNSSKVSNKPQACEHSFAENSFACTDRVCLICGVKVKASESHSYEAKETVLPTCEQSGYTLNACGCGATMKNNTVSSLGHDFGEYVETEASSCHSVGVETATCSRCKAEDHRYEGALSHTLTKVETVQATCTTNGYTVYHCSACEEELYGDYVRMTGHTSDIVHEKTVAASCEEDGYDEYKCSVCQEMYYENVVPAFGHTWTEKSCSTCGMDSKALWLTEKEGYDGVIKYTNGKGWKISATGKDNYAFALSKEELVKQLANGAKKVTLTFGNGDYDGEGNPVNCKMWVIPKNVKGEDIWDFNVAFISQLKDNKDGTYSVEINLTNESCLFEEGIYFYVDNKDVGGKYVGACYVYDVVFS